MVTSLLTERAEAIHWETRQFAAPATYAPPASQFRGTTSVDDLLAEARATYQRISPRAAYQLLLHRRAVLVDIRPEAQRRAEGEVDAALEPILLERNVLEWRLDPGSSFRLPWVTKDSRVLVLCQEGYASSLAAANLVRLGLPYATDIIGGLCAWREAGLPLAPPAR